MRSAGLPIDTCGRAHNLHGDDGVAEHEEAGLLALLKNSGVMVRGSIFIALWQSLPISAAASGLLHSQWCACFESGEDDDT